MVGHTDIQDGHLECSFPLSVTWCRLPTTKSEIVIQRDCQNLPPGTDKHLCPQAPKARGKTQKKEGIYVRAFSTSHGVSLAGLLLPFPWTLKTSRPRIAPRGFPVSHSLEFPWTCSKPTILASSLFPPSWAHPGRGAHTYTNTCTFFTFLHCQGGWK